MPQPSMKNAIVDAARREFHERGYSATGIAAITGRAGVHKGSFYNHFASKEELAAEVVRLYANDQRMGILEDAGRAPLDRIRAHFEFIAGVLRAHDPIVGCLLANFSAEFSPLAPLVSERVSTSVSHWSELLADDLAEAASQAGVDSFDAKSAAWALLDSYEGAALRSRATGSPAAVEGFLNTTLPVFLTPLEP